MNQLHRHRMALALVLVAFLLAACEDPHTLQVKGRLVGTWVADSTEHGAGVARRTLTLHDDGRVRETVRITTANGAFDEHSREGDWSFDGVNFKRIYRSIDGKPLTNANFVYETFELQTVDAIELVARSNVGRGQVRFRREPAP